MVAQTNPPVILTASPDDIAFDRDPGSSYSDELTLVGTATPNSTITVYDGSIVLGTTTTNSAGVWSYATSSLTDGTHSFTATATIAGVTSAASSAMVQNVVGEITNFSPLTDQWSAPISVGGMPYYVENANINGNAPWAITQVDSHTLQFQVRPDDVWADNDSHRSEISGGTIFSAKSTINLSYQLTVQPGFNDTSNGLAWQILGQFHADDNDPTYQTISGGSPPLAFHLTGANGYGEGDYLAIQAFYALPGQTAWTAATTPGDTLNGYLWVSQAPIVRGQPIDIQLEVNFQNNSSGFLEVWINGQQVVDYHGALGYGGGVYWKEGIYEGWSSNQAITVDYANTVITSGPGAPLILGNVVNGNQVMLKGTAQANSTISIYDGATKLGTVTTSSSGSWFYETSALSVGGHNLTATATDSAGNVGAASTAASATISAFTGPMITSVVTSAPTGETVTGTTITFTLKMSSAVSVTGAPTLSLNDGGTAVYKSGSGTNSLTFTYTVGANDSSTKGLGITGANLPSGASITDSGGNAAILTGASVQFPGVIIDTQPVKTPVFGDPVDNGNGTFTFTGTADANTTVYFSTPYGTTLGNTSVDGTGHWTFTTPTFAGNTWNSIQAYDVNSLGDISSIGSENGIGFGNNSSLPPSPTITGNALVGNVATLYGAVTGGYSITTVAIFDGTTQIGTATVNSDNTWSFSTAALTNGIHSFSAQAKSSTGTSSGSVPDSITVGTIASAVDTIAPTVSSVAASGTGIAAGTGTLNAGNVVTLTVNLSEAVTVAGGTPTLTLNDGGVATYAGGSGTNALTFSYTVGAGQNTSDLAVTAVNLNAATVKDSAGNAANMAGAVTNPSGMLQIDTTAPTVSSVAASGTGIAAGTGTLNAGNVVTLTVSLSEAVTVAGGTPTLTLNDGGVATYAGGSGTNALTFSYTVGAGQNTADLAVTAVNLNAATVKDSAGNAANMAGAVTNPSGMLQIDTTAPTVSSVAASGTGIAAGTGTLNAGNVVTLTVNLSEAVTVAGGTPTLTLNDGGVATYAGGSGTNALTFSYTVGAGQNTADLAVTAVNLNAATVKDSAGNAANMAGAVTNPSGTLQIDTTAPTVSSVAASGTGIAAGTGTLNAGNVVTLTVNLSEAVTVAGGTPTLTLNDGGVATYAGGSGTNALTFSYTVGAGQNTSDLAVTAVNLNAATVKDSAGNAANMAGAVTNPSGMLQIDTTAPTVSSVAASGTGIAAGTGTLNAGNVVTLTVNLSEAVTVAGGTPTLTLNDGGVATYAGGSGTNALTFSYTVGAGQNTSDLAVTAVNLNAATVKDSAGNAANMAGAVTNPSGMLQIDTTAPTVSSVAASGTGIAAGTGTLNAGNVVTLTVSLSEAVTVAGGTPTLTLNDGGVATYAGGSGTNALTFSYTVGAGQNTADLAVTAVNLNSATVKDTAGNTANLAGAVTNPSGTLQIDTTAPVISTISETPATGALNAGKIVAYTITMSEAVTVNTTGGTPTLSLNDGGIATYVGGSGTSALTFSYTVLAGQNTPDLMVSAFNLNGAGVADGTGNSANLSLTGIAQGSPSIDTTTPTVSSAAASGTGITSGSGILNAGDVVTLTLNLSEAVTVAGGTPTLTLNDGGVATYAGGSGTSALTFSYTVGAGQNTADLAVTAVNLNSATVKDTAGNTANLAGAVTNPTGTLQIDTTAPTVASLVASGGGITAGNPVAGSVVTMTMKFTEAVTVAGGTPTLALTNGGAATYTGGSGTDTLTFSYTVGAGQDTSSLVVASVNLNSATVKDSAGNNASLAMTPVAGGGPAAGGGSSQPIDNTAPTVASMVASGSGITSGSGKLNTGKVVTLTVNLSEAVTVAGGTPTLTLNDGGVATYAGGSGTNALTFSYTVGAGQNTSDLAVTAVNLNAATVKDGAGNAANLAGAVTNPSGTLQIDTTTPTVSSVVASGSGIAAGSGVVAFGGAVALTVNFSEAVAVAGGTPTLTLNDGGVATYAGGSGTNVLTFSYTVGAGQNTSDLAVKAVNLNSATVTDSSGNVANLTGAVTNPSGALQIDTKIKLTTAGDNYLLLDSTRTGPSLKYEGVSLSIANDFTWYKPIAAVRTATGYDVALKANGSSQYMIASVDANGNWIANLTSIVSGTSSTLQSYESIFHADLNGDGVIVLSGSGTKISSGSLVVGSGATVEIPGAYSGTVSFAGSTGTLIIDNSTKFTGSFSGRLARGDIIDLTDVAGGANASLSYSGNASRGTLTVSDGIHSAKLAVVGNYSLGNFVASSDGNGGTSIVDPPLSGSTSVGAPSEGTAAWLAAVDQRLALWSQHVASAFPTSSVIDSGGFHTNGNDLGGQNSQLMMPVQRPQSNHTWG